MGRSFWQRLTQTAIVILLAHWPCISLEQWTHGWVPSISDCRCVGRSGAKHAWCFSSLGQISGYPRVPVAFCVQLNRIDENPLQSELADQENPPNTCKLSFPNCAGSYPFFPGVAFGGGWGGRDGRHDHLGLGQLEALCDHCC